jgi:hypothetical protein
MGDEERQWLWPGMLSACSRALDVRQDPGNPRSRWVTKMYEFLKKIAK